MGEASIQVGIGYRPTAWQAAWIWVLLQVLDGSAWFGCEYGVWQWMLRWRLIPCIRGLRGFGMPACARGRDLELLAWQVYCVSRKRARWWPFGRPRVWPFFESDRSLRRRCHGVVTMIAGEPLREGQLVAAGSDGRAYAAAGSRRRTLDIAGAVARVPLSRVRIARAEMGVVVVEVRWPWWRMLWFGWRRRRRETMDRVNAALRDESPLCMNISAEVV